MLGILKKLFRSTSQPEPADDTLAILARDHACADEFVSRLAQSEIWVLALGQNSTMPADNLSEDALLYHIERNAKELSKLSDSDSIVPFIFERTASPILPFFSSMDFAEHFIRTERWQSVMAFQTFQLRSGFITSPELADCHVILNLNSKSERPLTKRERESLREQTATA